MKYFSGILIFILLIAAAGLIFLYSGAYNISAMVPHNRFTLWVINTMTDNSEEHYSKDIKVPDNLNDSSLVNIGFVHYREMCQGCHGAPGIERDEIGRGLYPHPPNLAHSAEEMPSSELFWIIKNGIKMTGMPAFEKTHSDDKIWAIVAFMKTLPSMTKDQYQTLDKLNKDESDE